MVNQVTLLSCAVIVSIFCQVLCANDGNIRLIGSDDPWQGRVEIFYNNTWGTICDDFWDIREGRVICRQLGYSDAIGVYSIAAFGQGTGPIWLDNVRCTGTESKITDCPHNGWGVHNCRHSEDGGVACVHQDTNPTNTGSCSFDTDLCGYTNADDDDFDWMRHQNRTPSFQTGPTHDHSTGYGSYIYIETSWPRVQGDMARIVSPQVSGVKCVKFYYHMKGETVCELNVYIDDGTDRKMVWTQKGEVSQVWEKAVIPVKGYSSFKIVFEALVGTRHTGDIAIDDVAALTTSCDALVPTNSKPNPPDLSKINSTIRLVGNVSSAGRIEVLHNGRWGTICGSHFHLTAAKVVCRQLGFLDVETIVPCCSIHKPGKGIIWLDNLHCEGREPAITMCPHRGWGVSRCLHSQDVGVICKTKNTLRNVRLAGSDNVYEGRVEVQIGGIWGTIMDIGWDIYDSTVVCRQLGYSGASAVFNGAHYGVGKGPVWLSSARCIGNETSFSQCNVTQHQIQWNGPWWWNPHRHDAGVECYRLCLTGGKSKNEGVVEIFLGGSWGTICNDNFNMNASKVICRQMGYSRVVSMKLGYTAKPSNGSSPIITRVKCKGDEVALGLCAYLPLLGNIHSCTQANNVMLQCGNILPTAVPTTSVPTTSVPTTSVPTTSVPTTSVPTTVLPPGPNPGCDLNCKNCRWNSKHGGVCVCEDNQNKTIKCDVTIGVNVFEVTFSKIHLSSDFQEFDFKVKVADQLNKYCTANSCGENMSAKFTQDDVVIAKTPYMFNNQLYLQYIVFTPRQTKTIISKQIITNMIDKDKTLGGYSVVTKKPVTKKPVTKKPKKKTPQPVAQQRQSSNTVKIVVPIVVLVIIGVVVVVFFIYRKKMLSGKGSSVSQRYLHLSQGDGTDDQDDSLLTI